MVFADLGLGGVGVPRLVHHRREAVEVRPYGGLPRDPRLVARLEADAVNKRTFKQHMKEKIHEKETKLRYAL